MKYYNLFEYKLISYFKQFWCLRVNKYKKVQKYNLRIWIEYFKGASIVDFYFPRNDRKKSDS